MGIENLPKAKWIAANRQVILKGDFVDIEDGLLQLPGLVKLPPTLVYVDATSVRIDATADCPAEILMCGVPNILHLNSFVSGDLSDNRYRVNIADTTMDFDVSSTFWGNEKASQWYIIYAVALDADTDFDLKAMPVCRVKAWTGGTKVIDLGTNVTPATGIGYGWDTDSLAGYKILWLTGACKGEISTISANNNDNTTGGTITLSAVPTGTPVQGDSFIILPATNFRLLSDIFNDASSNITVVRPVGNYTSLITATFNGWLNPIWARKTIVDGCGAGGGGAAAGSGSGGGGSAKCAKDTELSAEPGAFYNLTIGAGGGGAGGTTSFGSLLSLPGGGAGSGTTGGSSGGDGGTTGEDSGGLWGGAGAAGIFGAGGRGGLTGQSGTAGGIYGTGGGGRGDAGAFGGAGSQGFLSIRTKI